MIIYVKILEICGNAHSSIIPHRQIFTLENIVDVVVSCFENFLFKTYRSTIILIYKSQYNGFNRMKREIPFYYAFSLT